MRDELLNLLAAHPFVPFEITMASWRSYVVRDPDLATVTGDILYLMKVIPDTHSVLRLAQISSFDIIE